MLQQRTGIAQVLQLAKRLGWSPGAVIDIGVDKGTQGLYDVWPDVPICLVEPSPRSKEKMERIAERYDDVRIYNVGASDREGKVAGRQHPTRSFVAMGDVKKGWGEPQEFPVMTLDSIVADAILPPPYVYKIDTDTHDREALAGSSETLKSTDLLITEVKLYRSHGHLLSPHELSKFMHQRGFVLFDLVGLSYSAKNVLRVLDMVYVRKGSELHRLARTNSQKKPHAQSVLEKAARVEATRIVREKAARVEATRIVSEYERVLHEKLADPPPAPNR